MAQYLRSSTDPTASILYKTSIGYCRFDVQKGTLEASKLNLFDTTSLVQIPNTTVEVSGVGEPRRIRQQKVGRLSIGRTVE